MPHRLPLVFAHGNGIPRPVYQKMLIGLSHRFIATGIDRFGHDPQYPVTEAWPRLLDQLRSHISSVGEPVTLLGHGSGGWLSLLAAYRMPELVSAVIMLDAPVPTLRQARLLGLLMQIGMGSIPGAIVGGMIIGFAEAFGGFYLSTAYKDIIAFGLLVLILSIRPQGLFAKGAH